ncbi:hypothetical protein RGUI_0822 [Rhodovulum sp. P5]|uniref:late transcriptional activator n=1 Tax=Rhodovulum phage vB_RhkS_P1 TaxID=1873452 RepID=UPI00080AA509|nr:hypothetical protein [Rhodovulum sp. P5]YP_009285907.1 late transcriptional activator [Rhodovulum phage vB_RhkS_P1]ANT39892.1 hypothetical protein Rhks_22 [Rhodovulum phage vB_RhkS_P1]ARE38963.1 hypothetical protein RGUI_0822 [Rhodovulum sp. P5]
MPAPPDTWIDELEHDLGQAAALRLLASAGGQRRNIPKRPDRSRLGDELGLDVVRWLSARFGGTAVDIPSVHGRERQDRSSRLRAAILDAGLTEPTRSANDIAAEFGVTAAYVHKLRSQMRRDAAADAQMPLPLFGRD